MWINVELQKTATAVAFVKKGSGLIKVNGRPISLLQPEILKLKTYEPMLLLGNDKFEKVDIRVRVKGGGTTSQIYAIRQALAKGMVAYYQKCESILNSLMKERMKILILSLIIMFFLQ